MMFKAAILTLVLLGQVPCNYFKEKRAQRDKIDVELSAICKKIPLPDDFSQPKTHKDLDPNVSIFYEYKSITGCRKINSHFTKYLVEEGWQRAHSREGTDFVKGEYRINIVCDSSGIFESRNTVNIACLWDPK